MAIYDQGPYWTESVRAKFTAQSALIQNPQVQEVIVVDNNPLAGNPLVEFAVKNPRIKYVPYIEKTGSSGPRNFIFQIAEAPRVAVVDPHVLLYHDFFKSLDSVLDSFGANCKDLFHGPLMTDNPDVIYATHLNDQWRAQMLGTWGMAWKGINKDGEEFLFSTIKPQENSERLAYVTLNDAGGQRTLVRFEVEHNNLPELSWSGHEAKLYKLGFTHPTEPFQIPGHGMGFFACRKDAWIPFHSQCEGFGGEEITTGHRFRRAGRKVWCVPGAKWWHDFWRPHGGVCPYAMITWNRIRNYVLEFRRLGMSLDPIRQHFAPVCPQHEWDQLVAGVSWPAGAVSKEEAMKQIRGPHGFTPSGNTRR